MNITDADRAGALANAKARTERQYRGTGTYRVTVGGYVIGQVERIPLATSKTAVWWRAVNEKGAQVGGAFNTRADAVEALAKTDDAAEAYRESAREGAHGIAESRRVRGEDKARLAELDAAQDQQIADTNVTTVEGGYTITYIGPKTYRVNAKDWTLLGYVESPAEARELILSTIEDHHRATIMRTLRDAKFAAALNLVDKKLVVTVYAPEKISYDLLQRTVAKLGVDIQETKARSVYAVVPI